MNVTVISCSLHPQSRSYVLAQQTVAHLQELGAEAPLYDLRRHELGMCDATTTHKTPVAEELIEAIRRADSVLLAMPVYNYDVNTAAKNLLEIGMRAWNHKLVGFLCAAGGQRSYMSVMPFANSLMLDFRCIIIPRFVYATSSDFGDDRQPTMYVASTEIQGRIKELATNSVRLAEALSTVTFA
ncbi:MAG TPA: NAD(P)H-dependent oxidoreductase [Caldilineaceae bacterium]|nr:NAD(P)H-dependent oxidoreductase [Caldilineaceae bacterium]HRW06891.1 NAD(P)H-dependent oxidoreductase [Caldilineaceae bacterium]